MFDYLWGEHYVKYKADVQELIPGNVEASGRIVTTKWPDAFVMTQMTVDDPFEVWQKSSGYVHGVYEPAAYLLMEYRGQQGIWKRYRTVFIAAPAGHWKRVLDIYRDVIEELHADQN